MQFRHTIVFAFAALFMAVSCISVEKNMGEDLIPGNQDMLVECAELNLPVQLKMAEPLQALSTDEAAFGAIRTPEFGLAEFATASDIRPNYMGWDFGKDPQVKEIYFLANVSQVFVPDNQQKGIPQIVTIHRTLRNIDSTTLCNNVFTSKDYDVQPLNDTECIYLGGDSLKVNLKKSYAEEILSATQKERDSLNLFMKRFKGILIKSSAPEDGVYGGRENFLDYNSFAIFIRVNFQPTWREGLARKDTLFVLTRGSETCLNISSYGSNHMATDTPEPIMNIEGAAGLKPYISKDDLKYTIDSWKKAKGLEGKTVVIARGALVFPFEIPENMDMTKYPANLYPCNREYDSTYKTNVFYPAADINVSGYYTGNINRSLKEYRMDIPDLVQDFVSLDASELDDLKHNLWIMPTRSSTDSYYGNVTHSIDLSTYYLGKLNGPSAERCPKLEIVYSVLD